MVSTPPKHPKHNPPLSSSLTVPGRPGIDPIQSLIQVQITCLISILQLLHAHNTISIHNSKAILALKYVVIYFTMYAMMPIYQSLENKHQILSYNYAQYEEGHM